MKEPMNSVMVLWEIRIITVRICLWGIFISIVSRKEDRKRNGRKRPERIRLRILAFERWCDNRIIEAIRPQKYNSFTIGPLVAYVLARQNEIKTVRIILTGKLNHLPDDAIRERVREMYV